MFLVDLVQKFLELLGGKLVSQKLADRQDLLKQRLEHDRNRFKESDQILSENWLIKTIKNGVVAQHTYRGLIADQINEFVEFFEKEGNQYLNPRLRKSAKVLTHLLRNTKACIVQNFFEVSLNNKQNGGFVFKFNPERKTSHDKKYLVYCSLQEKKLDKKPVPCLNITLATEDL